MIHDPDYYKKKVTVKYESNDIKFWFVAIENEMKWASQKFIVTEYIYVFPLHGPKPQPKIV